LPSRIVFAFSGWPDEVRAIRHLVEQDGDEVVTLTLDIGQQQDLDSVRALALGAGAVRAHVLDVRDALITDFFLPALRACGAAVGGVVLARDLSTAIVARSLVEIADVESTAFVAHGAAAQDGERHALFDALVEDLAPRRLAVLWPASRLTVEEQALDGHPSQNVLAREVRVTGAASGNQAVQPSGFYRLTREPASAPDAPAHLAVRFERGVPTAVNGVTMALAEILDSLDTIVGAHGVGRYDGRLGSYFDRRDQPTSHRGEAPSAFVLATSLDALERQVWPAELYDLKEQMAGAFRRVVRSGEWFSPTREAIGAFIDRVHANVTGDVRLDLFKGAARVVAVEF
jgi:argininosuccinate synthase